MTKKEIKVFGKRNKERIIPIHEQIISQIKKYTNKKNDIKNTVFYRFFVSSG